VFIITYKTCDDVSNLINVVRRESDQFLNIIKHNKNFTNLFFCLENTNHDKVYVITNLIFRLLFSYSILSLIEEFRDFLFNV